MVLRGRGFQVLGTDRDHQVPRKKMVPIREEA